MKGNVSKATLFIFFWMATLMLSGRTEAYDPRTHQNLGRIALTRSQTYQADLAWRLGISVDQDVDIEWELIEYVSDDGRVRFGPLRHFIFDGERLEDEGTRPFHHFFDPVFNRPLSIGGVGLGERSVDWAVETYVIDNQEWSLKDVKNRLYEALISESKLQSDIQIGKAFRALGHVLHHVQDMAQPQHVRNDAHLDLKLCGFLSEEFCIYEPSFYEWLSAHMAEGGFSHVVAGPVVGPSDPGNYPNVALYWERHYWTHPSGYGMADYSNRNFVTEDTNYLLDDQGNFQTGEFASPGVTGWQEERLHGEDMIGHDGQPLSGEIVLVKAPIVDSYLGTTPETTHYTSSYSMFAQDMRDAIDAGVPPERFDERNFFYLNRINMESANHHLYQRAIGYSAGFIDHVFRGRLEIVSPDDGVYSLVDHAVVNEVGGEVPEGFTSIKLKLRNATAPQSSPDSLVAADGHVIKAGKLVAVALFRPNPCYTPDLKGERNEEGVIPNGCQPNEWLRTEQHRVVSAEIDLPAGLSTTEFSSFTFDFSANPIPVNARDLSIQVIFRGELGGDSDAFAVARKDISEPTWIGAMNSTDYFGVNGDFQPTDAFLASPEAEEWGIDTDLERRDWGRQRVNDIAYFNQRTGERLTDWISLEEHQYFRLAALVEPDEFFWVDVVVFLEHMYYNKSIGFSPVRISLEENPEVVTIPGFGDIVRLARRWTVTAIPSFRGASGLYIDAEHLWLGDYPTFEDDLMLPDAPDVGDPLPAGVSGGLQ